MWEVMNACVMHNMIIESERDTPVQDDQPFDYQWPLAKVDHVPQEFAFFFICTIKFEMHMSMHN
jgi:hypothetical protein